jgi:hypothetical protein
VFLALKIIVIIKNDIVNNYMATEKSNEAAYIVLAIFALTHFPEAPLLKFSTLYVLFP